MSEKKLKEHIHKYSIQIFVTKELRDSIKELADKNRRSMGNQLLYMAIGEKDFIGK